MGIAAEDLQRSLDELARREPAFAAALARAGYPEPRISDPGYVTLLRTIVGHRTDDSAGLKTPCAFADQETTHPLGRRIQVLTDELHSSYRIRGKEIVVVNRTTKDRKFTITVLESITNK